MILLLQLGQTTILMVIWIFYWQVITTQVQILKAGQEFTLTLVESSLADTSNTLPAPRAAGDRGGTFSWFDLDGEGDLDYFIAGQYFVPGGNGLVEAQMHVYRNDVVDLNEAPTMPTGLTANVISESNVLFSWNPSSDDHTPSPAITYDLVVVRTGTHVPIGKNGNLILTRLPEPGNISAVIQNGQ